MEYNLYHAIDAGFNHVVFITQACQKAQLEREIITRLPKNLNIDIVIQSLNVLPKNCHIPSTRTKPLGTAHALWCAKNIINENFVVINADDYYGQQAFSMLKQKHVSRPISDIPCYAMVAYLVQNTLSNHGGVNRGLCQHDNKMQLKKVTEVENIQQSTIGKNTVISGEISTTKQAISLADNALVSMNCWAFNRKIFSAIEQKLSNTFTIDATNKTECYLPDIVMYQLEKQQVNVDVLKSEDNWFGVTYAADSLSVDSQINQIFSPSKQF